MHRFPLIRAGVLFCFLTSSAAAQSSLPDLFDCPEFLDETNIGAPEAAVAQRLPGMPERRLLLPAGAPFDLNWLPSLLEDLPPRDELVYKLGLYTVTEPAGAAVGCLLFLAQFNYRVSPPIVLDYQDGRGSTGGMAVEARLPILMVGRFENDLQFSQQLDDWFSNSDFGIRFPAIDRPDDTWSLSMQYFDGSVFLPEFDGMEAQPGQGLVVSMDDPPDWFRNWLADNSIDARDLLVFCSPDPCETLLADPAGSTESELLESEADAIEGELGTVSSIDTERELPDFASYDVALQVVGVDGQPDLGATAVLPTIGPLECLLYAMAPDVFIEPPSLSNCNEGGQRNIRDFEAAVRVTSPGRWQLVERGAIVTPTSVRVSLPEGQDTNLCTMSVGFFSAVDGARFELLLTPGNAGFVAEFPAAEPPMVNNGQVELELLPSDVSACGGPARIVTVNVAEVLEVNLAAGPADFRMAVHLALPMAGRRESELGLGPSWNNEFGEALLDAVGAAHVRLSATEADRPWALRLAAFGVIASTGSIETIVDLPSAALRTNPLQRFGDPATRIGADVLGRGSTRFDSATLGRAIDEAVRSANEIDVDHLTITLIAPILESSEMLAASPCGESPLTEISLDNVAPSRDLLVDIVAFPIIGLGDRDRIDGTNLVPIAGQSAEALGGLYRCMGSPNNVSIYPFFVEPWRGPMDILPRYATALSDQLYLTLLSTLD